MRALTVLVALLVVLVGGWPASAQQRLLHQERSLYRNIFVTDSGRVKLLVATDPVRLPPDEAIALALLANEAVTNAYKHAFPQRSGGRIAVTLRGSAGSMLTLQITDDGVGIAENPASAGMGLKIIRNFATQLGGALTISPADGSGTTIALKLSPTAPLPVAAALKFG